MVERSSVLDFTPCDCSHCIKDPNYDAIVKFDVLIGMNRQKKEKNYRKEPSQNSPRSKIALPPPILTD